MMKKIHVLTYCTFLTAALKEIFSEVDMVITADAPSLENYINGGNILISLYGTVSPLQRVMILDKYRYYVKNPKWNVIVVVDTTKPNEIKLAELMGVNIISITSNVDEFKKECFDWLCGLKVVSISQPPLSGGLGHLTSKEWSAMTCLVRGGSFFSLSRKSSTVCKTIYNQRYNGLNKIGLQSARNWHVLLT